MKEVPGIRDFSILEGGEEQQPISREVWEENIVDFIINYKPIREKLRGLAKNIYNTLFGGHES